MPATLLPPDSHVHTEWSWDAPAGSMADSCSRAVALGLPAIAFTEHVDLTRWVMPAETRAGMTVHAHLVGSDGRFDPPPLDVEGYFEALERCKARFPELRILSGVEVGEPHWFRRETDVLLSGGAFDRVLGSLHSVELDGRPWIIDTLIGAGAPAGVEPRSIVRAYLAEALRMVEAVGDFAVLAHIDYPARHWPPGQGPFSAGAFEEEFRAVLEALARSGRALEINTRRPFEQAIVAWWYEAGGEAVSFGSDAHRPDAVATGFAAAAAMAEAAGFRPGRHPFDVWRR
jgi:histidinol-phosphatase (PHP family)